MRKGCRVIPLEKGNAIICGGEPTDHECNEEASTYITFTGGRFYFKDPKEGDKWYNDNYRRIQSASVACSICGRAVIDNAPYL